MDDNPYRSPVEELDPKPPVAASPNRRAAVICALFGALFAFMFAAAASEGVRTMGGIVMLAWALATSVVFFAMASGTWSGKRWPVVVGFLTVFIALASMFTIVINFSPL